MFIIDVKHNTPNLNVDADKLFSEKWLKCWSFNHIYGSEELCSFYIIDIKMYGY